MTLNCSLSIWPLRLLLASLLFFGSEILLWQNPLAYDLIEWSIRILTYPILATLVIDVVVRYRIREVYDAMLIITGYALLHSFIISPESGWQRIPDSLLIHTIGSVALTGIIFWGIFLVFLRGDLRKYQLYLMIAMVWLGVFWGTWMRWTPELQESFPALSLSQMFTYAGIAFVPILLLYLLSNHFAKDHEAKDYLLTPLEWGLAAIVLIGIFLYQAVSGTIGTSAVIISALLMGLCWAVIWSRRDEVQISLMDKHFPQKPLHILWLIGFVTVFVASTIIAYNLPLAQVPRFNQLWLMEIGIFAVGTLWMPFVAVVLAIRGLDRAMREGQRF